VSKLYNNVPDMPPEMMQALFQVMDIFRRLPEPSMEKYMMLLSLVMVNAIGALIEWPSTADRNTVVAKLVRKLWADLRQIDDPNAGVEGHA
jgi:hypothetical protein